MAAWKRGSSKNWRLLSNVTNATKLHPKKIWLMCFDEHYFIPLLTLGGHMRAFIQYTVLYKD